ncbi:hypothetical protein ES703_14122 [subsurface metagenome]
MEEAEDFGLSGGQDVFGKSGKSYLPGASPINHGGHGVSYPGDIRFNGNRHDAIENVAVHINKPRGDNLAFGIYHLLAFLWGYVLVHGGNLVSVYGHVQSTI